MGCYWSMVIVALCKFLPWWRFYEKVSRLNATITSTQRYCSSLWRKVHFSLNNYAAYSVFSTITKIQYLLWRPLSNILYRKPNIQQVNNGTYTKLITEASLSLICPASESRPLKNPIGARTRKFQCKIWRLHNVDVSKKVKHPIIRLGAPMK